MKLNHDDPRLMDYVLNELDAAEHAEIEAALKLDENAEAREEVAALRQLVDLSTEALATEETAVELEKEQRARVIKEARQGEAPAKKPFFLFRPGFALVACALIGVGLVLNGYVLPPKSERMELAARQDSLRARVERLPEGAERFLITDINNPAGSVQASPRRFLPQIESGKNLEEIEQEMDAIERQLISAGVGEQMGLLTSKSINMPTDTQRQLEALGYLGETVEDLPGSGSTAPAEPATFDEWDDLEVGSISGQQDLGMDADSDAQAMAKREVPVAKPAPTLSADEISVLGAIGYLGGGGSGGSAGGQVQPEPLPAVAATPPVPTPQASTGGLQSVATGDSIRIRGNYYDMGDTSTDFFFDDADELAFWEQRTRLNVTADGVTSGIEAKKATQPGNVTRNFATTVPGGKTTYLGVPWFVLPESQSDSDAKKEFNWYGHDTRPRYDISELQHRQSGEAYLPIVEKDFASVLQNPLSTFSIDVDTGAYSNVRRFIERGQLPDPNAVRIEELINYFDYMPSAPVDDAPFGVGVEVSPCPWQPEHWLSKVIVSGKEVPQEDRDDANLVFLLDVSGSMSDSNKLPLVKASMEALVKELRPTDRVALVTYAGSSQVVLDSTKVREGRKITKAINSLHAGGGTNGSGGIEAAYRIAKAHYVDGGINRVILATDGDFNIGVTHHGGLMGLITEHAKSNVFLTALGYGMGNYKDATLEQLADKGNGNYAYIDTIKEARKVLVEELSGTMITIAKDVKIQVEFNPQHIGHYRLIGYENRALKAKDFNDDTKDAGEIGAGHQVTALYELVPAGQSPQPGVDALKYQSTEPKPTPAKELNDELMNVKLRYKDPEGSVSAKLEVPVKRHAVTRAPSADFRFAAAVAGYGFVLRNSQYKGTSNLDGVIAWAESGKDFSIAKGLPNFVDWNDAQAMITARQDFIDLVITTKTLAQR